VGLQHIKDYAIPFPFVPGYEVSGTVLRTGQGVAHLSVGDSAVVQPMIHCGQCVPCQRGQINLCQQPQIIGLHRPGGMAEHIIVPAGQVYLTGSLPASFAVLTEHLACVLHGLKRMEPRPSDRVLILGAGTIGLLMLQVVRGWGIRTVIAVDLHRYRLEKAVELGADNVFLADDSLADALRRDAPLGYDCVVEASGTASATELAFAMVAAAGRLLLLGSNPTKAAIAIHPRIVQSRDITVVGSISFTTEFPEAIQLLQGGQVDLDPIVSHRFSLRDYERAFTMSMSANKAVKVILQPNSA